MATIQLTRKVLVSILITVTFALCLATAVRAQYGAGGYFGPYISTQPQPGPYYWFAPNAWDSMTPVYSKEDGLWYLWFWNKANGVGTVVIVPTSDFQCTVGQPNCPGHP